MCHWAKRTMLLLSALFYMIVMPFAELTHNIVLFHSFLRILKGAYNFTKVVGALTSHQPIGNTIANSVPILDLQPL